MTDASPADPVVLVVDVANVMGSRPDGWWRDRVGAARRLIEDLTRLAGRTVALPGGPHAALTEIVAVVEGRAVAVGDLDDDGLRVVRAPRDGDTTIAEQAADAAGRGQAVVVVTADRGLRARLPTTCGVAGPRWLLALLEGVGITPG